MQSGLEETFAAVLAATGAYLATLGFKKRRQSFRRMVGSNVAVVELQRSTANDAGHLRFTLNVAVLSAAVAAKNGADVQKLGAGDGHLRVRIGSLMGEGDKWWSIEATSSSGALSDEVVAAVREMVIPYLDRYSRDDALRALWASGRSPGLTAAQRQRCLAALDT